MRSDEAHLSRIQIWKLAVRPKTLPAAASPVVLGSALAFSTGEFDIGIALATLVAALLLQIGANLANDVFDFHRGVDTHDRLGPLRTTQAGLLEPNDVLRGMWITFGIASVLGIYLYFAAGWLVVLLGLSSILTAIVYTGGPFPLGYYGLGDLLVFIFFGPVAVCGTYFIQTNQINSSIWIASLTMGFLITAILVVNNLRDIETDRKTGKRTLAVRLGPQKTRIEYLICLAGAYLVPAMMVTAQLLTVWVFLVYLSLPYTVSLVKSIKHDTGRSLNTTLARTGQLTLIFSLLFSTGTIIPELFKL